MRKLFAGWACVHNLLVGRAETELPVVSAGVHWWLGYRRAAGHACLEKLLVASADGDSGSYVRRSAADGKSNSKSGFVGSEVWAYLLAVHVERRVGCGIVFGDKSREQMQKGYDMRGS